MTTIHQIEPGELGFDVESAPGGLDFQPRAAGVVPWVGPFRIAVVPVFDSQVDPPAAPDWEYQVRSRMFYDPDPVTGLDRSFQAFLHALSYGQAFVESEVFPAIVSDGPEVNIPAMKSLPHGHGYTHLLAVLPHSFGQHRGGHAFMDVDEVNGIRNWARVAMFTDKFLTMRQPIGVWAMEILHMTTRVTDLYYTNPNLGAFDVMADANASTHATAHTKEMMGWLPHGRIAEHLEGTFSAHLHAIAMPQPPPPDRVTAVRVPSHLTSNHFMIEARVAVDQYERKDGPGDGLPAAPGSSVAKEGVIVYEVADPFSVFLRSGGALGVGEQYDNPAEGLRVEVPEAIPGGFGVVVYKMPAPFVRGRLLFYRDASQTGGGDVSSPKVIGLGGWDAFRFLFSGGNGAIYAVDQAGRLLRYQDHNQDGTGDVSSPAVIGQGGWQQFRFLFSGGNNVIYAVDQAGRLLFYRDASQTGGGDVSSPAVIGQGGWQQFRFLFGGSNGVIYAVDQAGRLLRYRDHNQDGTGDVHSPAVIGQGGWQQFKFLFSGGNNIIYAVPA